MSRPKRIKRDAPRGAMKLYKSYMFRNKDPVIDELRTLLTDAYGRVGYKSYKQIEQDGGPTTACLHNWFEGETKRPQSASIEAAGRALGFKRVWVKSGNNGRKDGG